MTDRHWFDATFERGPMGAVLLAPDGRVARTNEAFRQLVGLDREVIDRTVAELFASGAERFDAARRGAQADGRSVAITGFLLEPARRDRRHTVDLEFYPQTDERGKATGVLVLVKDRTPLGPSVADRTRLFYQSFLHSTNAMEITDRDGFLVDVNPAFERIYGYSREEVLGRRPSVVASSHTDRSVYERMWDDLLDPAIGAWSGELINVDRKGKEHPVLLTITAIRDLENEITHFLGVAVDLTERRAWEQQAIHSERLVSLGQLAAGVAHELNTPLANITLIAESIRRRSNDPWTRARIDSVLTQTDTAAKIVRGLLDFGRRPESKIVDFDLRDAVRTAVDFLKDKQSQDVDVKVDTPSEPLVVRGHPDQIGQVVTNLLNNAYDALAGKGEIRVRANAADGWGRFSVTDNGPGIPPDVRRHLFEPFFTTKSEGKGTGLGLAICRGIVEAHGGTIELETEVGRGTTFEVGLPLVARPDSEPRRDARHRAAPGPSSA
ncbi:MAG TPA: ATP-binding protein [Thermoplasmata archaeon]|nr:ATP-binding protein [Thermoplasmata archaeon]